VKQVNASALNQALSTTPECIAIERLAETLSPGEREHVETCTRCQTEVALWREFDQAEASADEGAAVQWIVAELGRRNRPVAEAPPAKRFAWLTPAIRRWSTAVAAVALVTTAGYLTWDREPAVHTPTSSPETYRTGQLQIVGPIGDVPNAPAALEWVPAKGAVSYDVSLLEVDRTPLWRSISSTPRIALPPPIVNRLVPGKAILWEVRARNGANTVIAESGTQQFRVELAGRSPKD